MYVPAFFSRVLLDDVRISPIGYIDIIANGGDGGHGARGGSGGAIQVSLLEADMDLLALVATNVDGGQGGRAGANGAPGSGGAGGKGGNSHTYTKTVRKKDSKGEWVEEEVTVTIPGGQKGQNGVSGSRAYRDPRHGMDGADGQENYTIQTSNGDRHYSGVYHLKVKNFSITSANQDGIIEPGEQVFLKDFEVENVGPMPTPPHSKVEIFLTSNEYITADPIILTVNESLQPGESHC